jgi:Ser/Thr protein kinase RdoA (MazF antagonist)
MMTEETGALMSVDTVMNSEVDRAAAARIARAYFGRDGDSLEWLPGGVNHVYRVSNGSESIVIRIAMLSDEHRAERFFEMERWCIERASKAGVPGPAVLGVGRSDGRTYMLQRFVLGDPGTRSKLHPEAIWRTLGTYARAIHGIALDGFGEHLADFTAGARTGWRTFVQYNLDSLTPTDELLALDVYRPCQRAALEKVFSRLLDTPFAFGLTHGDLSPRNVIVDGEQRVTLLDWGCAEAHIVPHYELVGILRAGEADAACLLGFLEGYGTEAANLSQILADVRAVRVLKAIDLTRWAIARCPDRRDSIAAAARETVARCLG